MKKIVLGSMTFLTGSDKFIFKKGDIMKKAALALSIIFIILTLVGAGYVLYNGGKINAGYAVVPMVFALASITFYRTNK
ncbi:MAG: hypothetical protein HFG65_16175 [Hungatella sp.]|nr:hypothetical protein [Hungatella sp.]